MDGLTTIEDTDNPPVDSGWANFDTVAFVDNASSARDSNDAVLNNELFPVDNPSETAVLENENQACDSPVTTAAEQKPSLPILVPLDICNETILQCFEVHPSLVVDFAATAGDELNPTKEQSSARSMPVNRTRGSLFNVIREKGHPFYTMWMQFNTLEREKVFFDWPPSQLNHGARGAVTMKAFGVSNMSRQRTVDQLDNQQLADEAIISAPSSVLVNSNQLPVRSSSSFAIDAGDNPRNSHNGFESPSLPINAPSRKHFLPSNSKYADENVIEYSNNVKNGEHTSNIVTKKSTFLAEGHTSTNRKSSNFAMPSKDLTPAVLTADR